MPPPQAAHIGLNHSCSLVGMQSQALRGSTGEESVPALNPAAGVSTSLNETLQPKNYPAVSRQIAESDSVSECLLEVQDSI